MLFAIHHPPTWYDLQGKLGNWMSPTELEENVSKLFPGCMQGRTMYMIPFRCPMMMLLMIMKRNGLCGCNPLDYEIFLVVILSHAVWDRLDPHWQRSGSS